MDERVYLDMIKEVYTELRSVNTKIDAGNSKIMKEISINREEFVIFKTKVNTRTAMISAIIGLSIALAGIFLQHKKTLKDNIQQTNYEQVDIKTT